MEGPKMTASNPWVLAIEALLYMQQVDISIILELIKSVPDVCDELGRNARELLAIRVLENLYAREIHNKNGSVLPLPASLTKIDDSQFCEEVVNHILQGSPENLRFDVAHILELDVPTFISEKRSRMQNCHLHQLKNEILEGSNPILKPLKDASGLEVHYETSRTPVDGGVSNGIADKQGVAQNSEDKRKLASLTAEDSENSEENLPAKHLPPANRDAGPCGTSEECRKKLKFDLSCLPQKTRDLSASACQHERLVESSYRTVENIDEPVAWETGPEVHSMEERKDKEDHFADASARLKSNDDIDHVVVLQCQQLYAPTPEDISREDDAQVNFSEKASGGNQCSLEPPEVTVNDSFENVEENGFTEANETISQNLQHNVDHAMGKENDVHGDNLEISSDHNEYHDVRADIAMSKNHFLSSQGVNTQDSLETQLNICVKCNKDGKLLVCSSSSCPLVVHEECLGSAIDFDILTKFYCPFCAYSRAISRYLEAKKNFSRTRTELRAFLEFGAKLEKKSSSKRLNGSKKHGSSEIQNRNKNIEPTNSHDFANEATGPMISPSKLAGQVGELPKTGPRVETSSDENEKSCSKYQDIIIPGSTERKRMRVKKQLAPQSDADATCVPQCTGTNAESSNDGSDKCDSSRYCIRPRKKGRQIMEPIAPVSLRRKVMPWTNVEEQTLKEGVRRFASEEEITIPWKQIWEFGADVFQHRRNTIDLKDKWRNICKRGPMK